ncbi:MAG: ubiquitin-conjugating enzyme E2 J2 [Bacillariaceae sp.]|jgi:ubiquitin-conjugating enzyme E2 J2
MAPAMATKRLRKELIKLQTEPPPGVIAEPDEANILKWYYAIRGPEETPYENGIYIGKLIFPTAYPMKAPSIYMLTPSGRFQISTKICMSMSDFHPESWNPLWSVATIIQGVQSFMDSEELTTGGLKASESDRKKYAKLSIAYNQKTYPKLFQGDIEAAMEGADQARQQAEEDNTKTVNSCGDDRDADNKKLSRRERRLAKNKNNNKSVPENEEKLNEQNQDADNNKDENNEEEAQKELSPEEIEKRKKRNAKKRAKQKAKKAVEVEVTQEEEGSGD